MKEYVKVSREEALKILQSCKRLGFSLIDEGKGRVVWANSVYIAVFDKVVDGYIYTLVNNNAINRKKF